MLALRWRIEKTSCRFRVVLHLDLVEGSVQSTGLLLMCHSLPACICAPHTGSAAVDAHVCSLGCLTGDLMSKNLLKSFFGLADPVYLPSLSCKNILWVPSCGVCKISPFVYLRWDVVNNLCSCSLCGQCEQSAPPKPFQMEEPNTWAFLLPSSGPCLSIKDISKDFCLGSIADPEDNKEDGSQGAADARGGRAEASEDGAGAAVHSGEAGGWWSAQRPQTGIQRGASADRGGADNAGWVL